MLLPLFLIVSCLVSFSIADTAKEAHDKNLECSKKCSKYPNALRCEMECQKTQTLVHLGSNKKVGKHTKPQRLIKNKSKPGVETKIHAKPQHQPKAMTIKGRRVYLIRKN